MNRRTVVAFLLGLTVSAGAALAQPAPIGTEYENNKAAEISAARLRLATRPAASGVQELNEAESLLRRLRSTKGAEARRALARQLDLAVTRLNIVASEN
jgi:hypothetical protein